MYWRGEPMPESLQNVEATHSVVIIDALNLRRAGIASLLEPWAASARLRLVLRSPSDACDELHSDCEYRMLIFSLGGDSILRRENQLHLKVVRAIAPDVPLVIVCDHATGDEVAAALSIGAQGFVHTDIAPELALQAFSFILSGGSYFPPSAMRLMQGASEPEVPPPAGEQEPSRSGHGGQNSGFNGYANGNGFNDSAGRASNLTGRQKAVLERLRQGDPNKQIARRLGMTEGTVKVHVRQIMRKLGATNRTQAAICASATT
jgi:DNA-binding NarL/FixJ family response regulator